MWNVTQYNSSSSSTSGRTLYITSSSHIHNIWEDKCKFWWKDCNEQWSSEEKKRRITTDMPLNSVPFHKETRNRKSGLFCEITMPLFKVKKKGYYVSSVLLFTLFGVVSSFPIYLVVCLFLCVCVCFKGLSYQYLPRISLTYSLWNKIQFLLSTIFSSSSSSIFIYLNFCIQFCFF